MDIGTKEVIPHVPAPLHWKCNYGPCHCRVERSGAYCCRECEQASAQGVERDYCQCAHEAEKQAAVAGFLAD